MQEKKKNLILTGSPGSGKTLGLMETLKMKVAYYKVLKKKVQILLVTYIDPPQLQKEMADSYNIQYLLEDYKIQPKALSKLSKGILCTVLNISTILILVIIFYGFLFSEYGFEYHIWDNPAAKNINNFLEALHKKNLDGGNNDQWIIIFDELRICRNHCDLSSLKLDYPKFDLHIAINPNIRSCEKGSKIKLPKCDENTICMRLSYRHRNCLEVAIFVLHLKKIIEENIPYNSEMCLSDDEDMPLVKSCFPSGRKPVYILKKENLPCRQVLAYIKEKYVQSTDETVALLYSSENQLKIFAKWCELEQHSNWKSIDCENITGCEASVVILFDVSMPANIEYCTRARNCLIIVHK